MSISVLEEKDLSQWDEWVVRLSGSPFLTSAWLEAFRNPDRIPIYFRFVSEGQTVGLLSGLVFGSSNDLIKQFEHPIFTFTGPAVLPGTPESIKQCLLRLIDSARRHGYTSLQLNSWDYPFEYDLGDQKFYRQIREEYLVDLQPEWPDVLKKIRKKMMKRVEKSEKNGLEVHQSNSAEILAELIRLLEETKSRRLTKGYGDYSYFYIPYLNQSVIARLLSNRIARIFYVRQEDTILSAQLIVGHARRAFFLLGGTTRQGYKVESNALNYFKVMEQLHQEGYQSFNLGGVANDAGGSGLVFFKTSFGAEKRTCIGGATPYLKNPFYNLLHQVYSGNLSLKTLKLLTQRRKDAKGE